MLPMNILVVGGENNAKPSPIKIKPIITTHKPVLKFRKDRIRSPIEVIAIPVADNIRLSMWSDKRPTGGENIATIKGSTEIIMAVIWGPNDSKS